MLKNEKMRVSNSIRAIAMKDMIGERVESSSKKHWKYKSSDFQMTKNGFFNVEDVPYNYNFLIGKTV